MPIRSLVLALAVTVVACSPSAKSSASSTPSSDIAAKAAAVMPFDLKKTTHLFADTASGGTQTVTIDNPVDTDQLPLIRTHLANEAAQFRAGNYSDPAKIHGMDMPGMQELTSGFKEITVTVDELPNGAVIGYDTENPKLISAIHAWFDRQRNDHTGQAG